MKNWYLSKSPAVGILSLMFLIGVATPSETEDLDWKEMQRDLGILEGVLNNLLTQNDINDSGEYCMIWDENPDSKGIYIQGYGAIFAVGGSHSMAKIRWRSINSKSKSESNSAVDEQIFSAERNAKFANADVTILKNQITEFFATYADAIGQMENDDRITVLIAPGSNGTAIGVGTYFSPRNMDFHTTLIPELKIRIKKHFEDAGLQDFSTEFDSDGFELTKTSEHVISDNLEQGMQDSLLRATVTVRDLKALGKGQIDDKALQDRITFQLESGKSPVLKRINIMSGILDAALGKSEHTRNPSNGRTRTKAFYQKNLGAIFLLERSFPGDIIAIHMGQQMDRKSSVSFQDTLIETIAEYGHTLKGLESDDQIIVHVDSTHPRINLRLPHQTGNILEHQNPFVLKVSKKDVDAYHGGKVTLDTLRKRIEITEIDS